jgi:hypothetical protein
VKTSVVDLTVEEQQVNMGWSLPQILENDYEV